MRGFVFGYVSSNRGKLAAVFFSLLLLFFFFGEIKSVAVVALLAFLGSFGQIYKRYVRITSAFELVTFGTVVVAFSYGPLAGALFAFAVSFAAEVISGNVDAFLLVYLPVRVLSGVFAAFVPAGSVFAAGLATTLFINMLSQPVYLMQGDSEMRLRGLAYLVANIFFNALLFSLVGEAVAGMV